MRWPWMSKDAHEQIASILRQKLAESEIERKRAIDELTRVMGGQPFNFPQAQQAAKEAEASTQTEVEPDPIEQEADWLEYVKNSRPSEYAAALASVMAKRRPPMFPSTAKKNPEVVAAFDRATQEVTTGANGHHAPATT